MTGITIEDLKDKLANGHEAEFSYLNCEYSIESEETDGLHIVKIWNCSQKEPVCLAEKAIKSLDDFDDLFATPCFEGKSFCEIESEVTVTIIF